MLLCPTVPLSNRYAQPSLITCERVPRSVSLAGLPRRGLILSHVHPPPRKMSGLTCLAVSRPRNCLTLYMVCSEFHTHAQSRLLLPLSLQPTCQSNFHRPVIAAAPIIHQFPLLPGRVARLHERYRTELVVFLIRPPTNLLVSMSIGCVSLLPCEAGSVFEADHQPHVSPQSSVYCATTH